MTNRILDIENVKVRYSGLPVLQGVSLHVDAGETVSVLGANGAGKSTLLRAVMGAQPAFEGHIRFEGRDIQKMRTPDIVNLGIVALRLRRKLYFDPVLQQFEGDEEANRLINQPMRAPWHV